MHERCAISVAGVGAQDITFVRCYLEARRVQLVARRLSSDADLVDVVQFSLEMSNRRQLPAVGDKRAFNARCREVLEAVNPGAEMDAKKLTVSQKLRLALVWGQGEGCYRCTKPATRGAAFDSWTGTYRTRLADFTRNTNTEVHPKLFCRKCVELPITACGVCGGFEFEGELTKVLRDAGYEILVGVKCKVCCNDVHRSVAFEREHDDRALGANLISPARIDVTASELDEALRRSRPRG